MSTSPNQVSQLWFLNQLVTVRVARSENQDGISVLEHRVPQGDSPPMHFHRNEDEIIYILEGEIRVKMAGEERRAGTGEVLLVPKGVPHTYRVESREGGRFITVTVRGEFERFVRAMSRPAERAGLPEPAGAPSPEMMQAFRATASQHGIEFVGPPLS
jgi:quercetin dioxygenase-like cupin family protein